MTTRPGRIIAAAALGLTVLAGCTGTEGAGAPPPPDQVDLGPVRLISSDSCGDLLDWFHREGAARVGPYGLETIGTGPMATDLSSDRDAFEGSASSSSDAATAAPSAQDAAGGTSTTNTQEPGIGEPDLTWSDGRRLVSVVDGRLRTVDLTTAQPTGTLDLDEDPDAGGTNLVGLLVDGDHAVVIQSSWDASSTDRGGYAGTTDVVGPGAPQTVLTRIDLGGTPTVVGRVSVRGQYVDARMVEGVVRAVVRSSPTGLGFVYPSGSGSAALERARTTNEDVVADTDLDDWLPSMTVTGEDGARTTRPAVGCGDVARPTAFGGFEVVSVVGLDLRAGAVDPLPTTAVVAGAGTVYASDRNLYVTTTRYPDPRPEADPTAPTTQPSVGPDQIETDVHAFSLPDGTSAHYEASGSVPGTLLDQFALSEHEGDLRVATTTSPFGGGGPMPVEPLQGPAGTSAPAPVSESRITVLRRDGDALEAIGDVVGLGPTEQIRGVRFAGPQGYVVTFRRTDPLYVVDLADPTAPRVAGELKVDGYSSYLQVIGEGRVLGLGQDATDAGRTTGFQESLFDVSDPSDPTRLAQLVQPGAASAAEADHHAVLWWPASDLLVVPLERWGGGGGAGSGLDDGYGTSGALVTRVSDAGIEPVGTVTHPRTDGTGRRVPSCPPNASCAEPAGPPGGLPTPIARALVADGRLVTVSAAGVKVSDLDTLADVAWIPFT